MKGQQPAPFPAARNKGQTIFSSSFSFFPPLSRTYNLTFLHPYYRPDEAEENPFICSSHRENGMQRCSNIPSRKESKVECTLSMDSYSPSLASPEPSRNSCINWNQYYNVCMAGDVNPHNGAINFDNIGYAWIAIFQVGFSQKWVVGFFFFPGFCWVWRFLLGEVLVDLSEEEGICSPLSKTANKDMGDK